VRPDNSQMRRTGAGRHGLSRVAAQLAGVRNDPVPMGRAARLAAALTGMAQDLAAARREIAVLKRENTALRSRLEGGGAT
jgi:hypothetical protein